VEEFAICIDVSARDDIVEELGSVNAFIDRLSALIDRESAGRASLVVSAREGDRGGGIIEVITAVSGLVAALSPIVIAWIKSRGFIIEEKTEITKAGKVLHTVRVRRGLGR
jgi:hypothetical protein